jgi:uncharacterized protein (DUF2267 family)
MRNIDRWQNDNMRLRAPGKLSSYDLHETPRGMSMHKHTEEFIDSVNVDFLPGNLVTSRKRSRGKRSPNFGKYVEGANRFVHEVAAELGITDGHQALRITKAVLQAVRDRLQPDDAIQFAQGLPMMIKAIYFDQYDISKTPVLITDAEEFLGFVREKDRFGAIEDFRSPMDVVLAMQAVFHVLENNMDYGQVEQVKAELPAEIQALLDTIAEDSYHNHQF